MSGKVGNGHIGRFLSKVLDCLTVPMRLSNWIHGTIDVMDSSACRMVSYTIPNSAASWATLFTCPVGEVWEVFSIAAFSPNQTYTYIGLIAAAGDTNWPRLVALTAPAVAICWYSSGPRLILTAGMGVNVYVEASSNVGAGVVGLRRVSVK